MNIFLAQSYHARNELKRIANVKLQIIGAKDSNPIIGCKQDAVSGAYMLTDPSVKLKGWEVANIIANTDSKRLNEIDLNKEYTGHEIFSFIIPPNITNIGKGFQVINGFAKSGYFGKSALVGKNSIIHFIWDKYGPDLTRQFIDDAQKLVLNYLLVAGQTCGFGDCIIDSKLYDQVQKIISNSVLESKYNVTQYENDIDQISSELIESILQTEINAIMSNVGNVISSALNLKNFFWLGDKSGAKGSQLNMSQITGSIGQVSVEGQRIKKSIEGRSTIYFHRDDDTPEARGFVQSSFITGMKGIECFFQSFVAREGFISTALSTARTGYIQRRLIKGLEDLIIKYDGTNRNGRDIIVQTVYGENGINQSIQSEVKLNILTMDNKTIKDKFGLSNKQANEIEKKLKIKGLDAWSDKYVKKLIKMRDFMRKAQSHALLNFKTIEENYMIPVNLYRLTQDYSTNKENIDLNPIDIEEAIEDFLDDYEYRLITICRPNDKYMKENDRALKTLFELALHQFLSPSKCIYQYGLTKEKFAALMKDIKDQYIKAIVEPGEAVGIIAAQSVGEPATQLTLNVKHSAAGGKKGGGVGRVEELINNSKNIKDPQMTIYFEPSVSSDRLAVNKIVSYFKHLTIKELISNAEIYYDLETGIHSKKLKADNVLGPFFVNNQKVDINTLPFVFRLRFNLERLLDKETTLLDIKTKFVSYWYKNFVNIKSMKKNEKTIFTRVTRCAILSSSPSDKEQIIHIRFNMTSFSYSMLSDFLDIVLNDITLKGMEDINDVFINQEMISKYNDDGAIKIEKEFTCITNGINMKKLKLIKGIDMSRSRCNDTATILRTYGIEATRQILLYEIRTTYSDSGANINQNHLSLLVDQMCHLGEIVSIDRHGMKKLDSDPITRASFEKTMEHFEHAAVFNETDNLKSVSSRIALGRVIPCGTGIFDLLLDTNRLENSEYSQDETGGHITYQPLEIEPLLDDIIKYGYGNADFFAPVLAK